MRRYLLDTSVVSAFGPGKPPVATPAADWIRRNPDRLAMSVMTVMEIESGIRQFARTGSTHRFAALSTWLAELLSDFRDKIIAFDERVAMTAGRMEATALAKGRHPGLADIIIAATGEVHGLTILTQNVRHFRPLDVPCLDPFEHLPDADR